MAFQQKGAFCMLRSQTKAGLDAVNSEKAHYYKAKPNEEMEVEQKGVVKVHRPHV